MQFKNKPPTQGDHIDYHHHFHSIMLQMYAIKCYPGFWLIKSFSHRYRDLSRDYSNSRYEVGIKVPDPVCADRPYIGQKTKTSSNIGALLDSDSLLQVSSYQTPVNYSSAGRTLRRGNLIFVTKKCKTWSIDHHWLAFSRNFPKSWNCHKHGGGWGSGSEICFNSAIMAFV